METSEADPTVDNNAHIAKLAQYTANRVKDNVDPASYPRNKQSDDATDQKQETKLKKDQQSKSKKRTIEPQIVDMETEIVDPVQVLVPQGDDSDTDWTTAN